MENKLSKEEMLSIIDSNISKIDEKNFKIYFYVVDSEGYPNGMLEYIYLTAMELKEMGYDVTMLYSDDVDPKKATFVGVSEWLGEKFNTLTHKNVNAENVNISACDFLFIPEFSANVMVQTKDTPCKRIMILQSKRMLCDSMPIGVTPLQLKIYDCITPTEELKKYAEDLYPGLSVKVVRPCVRNVFRNTEKERRLIVNLFSKDRTVAKEIINPFYWKFPIYKFVTFRDLRGMPQENVAESLMDGAITIWIDDITEFGLPILQALKCGSIVLAKVPNVIQDWMLDNEGNLIDSVIWFDDIKKLPQMLAGLIRTWTIDEIPTELYDKIKEASTGLCGLYGKEAFKTDIEKNYQTIFNKRRDEFSAIRSQVNNSEIK